MQFQGSKVQMSLANLMGGAAVELFDAELAKVIANIEDPNTDDSARTITLSVKIKADRVRGFGGVEIKINSKLGTQVPMITQMFFGQDGKNMVAYEHNPKQMTFGDAPVDLEVVPKGNNIRPFASKN